MSFSKRCNEIFRQSISDYHQQDDLDQPMVNPFHPGSLDALLYRKNWIDTVQWHLEDEVRDETKTAEEGMSIKRRIDRSNQDRTDTVEAIEDFLMKEFQEVKPEEDARLNTESPGWVIDRLSILHLKIWHMKEDSERKDVTEKHIKLSVSKLNILTEQLNDLSQALDELISDIAAGRKRMKVYRQMKMYNDPELNPAMYRNKGTEGA